jgi:hypothetical protein
MRLLLLFNILLCQSLPGQNCPNDSLFSRFKYDVQIEMLHHPNEISWHDETRESFYTLMIGCPTHCLVKYTDDSIPAVRAIIFEGLVRKNADNDILNEILDRHKNDTVQFTRSSTCVVWTSTVIGHMELMLKLKANNKKFSTTDYYESLLANLRRRLQDEIQINVPGAYHSMVTKEHLLSMDSLTTSKGYRIASYDLIAITASGTKTIFTDNVFTPEIKELIKTMTSGDRIYLEDIRVEFPDKSIGIIGGKLFRIR